MDPSEATDPSDWPSQRSTSDHIEALWALNKGNSIEGRIYHASGESVPSREAKKENAQLLISITKVPDEASSLAITTNQVRPDRSSQLTARSIHRRRF